MVGEETETDRQAMQSEVGYLFSGLWKGRGKGRREKSRESERERTRGEEKVGGACLFLEGQDRPLQ